MSFSLKNYSIESRHLWFNPGVDGNIEDLGVVGHLNLEGILSLINEHASKRWEGTLPEGVKSEQVLNVDEVWDQVSVGAGAAMSPAGPIGVVTLHLQSSARAGDPPHVANILLPASGLRDLRQVFVQAFGKAIRLADQASRSN